MDVLDMNALEALRSLQEDGEEDLLAELIDLFLEDAPTRITSLREAITREDWSAMGSWAHSLKGSCGSLGATHMADLCAKLEAMGRTGSGPRVDAERYQRELEAQYELVRDALQRERAH
jgi:HPt (histidine-containing phosphotransfer) domain-containing protein